MTIYIYIYIYTHTHKMHGMYIYIYIEDVHVFKKRTHAFELLLQLGHVIALGDPEVKVRIVSLRDAVGGSGCANG
jgi:hypothetical protein